MRDKLEKLINVKSIMTLFITIIFCILAYRGTIKADQFVVIFTTIIAFYFGTQTEKKKGGV